MKSNKLRIIPIGKIEQSILEDVVKAMKRTFKIPVEIGETFELPEESFNRFRNQYISDVILEDLEKKFTDRVLAVTDVDIYTDKLNFIFGQAKMGGNVSIVSLFRLDPAFYKQPHDEKLLKERLIKECIHEFGHLLGLRHCREIGCVMNFSNNIREVDNKTDKFCHMCQIQLNI